MSARLSVDEEEFAYKTISVTPLNPLIGAGVEVGRTPSNEQLSEIRRASLDHHVLVFCEQTHRARRAKNP
jgi:hypothetical protein